MLKENSSFFDRLMYYAKEKGIKNASDLARRLGYNSPEKLYRLQREENAHPSYEVVVDISKYFEYLNLRWLLLGIGQKDLNFSASTPHADNTPNDINEPLETYSPNAPQTKVTPETHQEVTATITPTPVLQLLLNEKDRVIDTQVEVINTQKQTIALLREKR